MPAGVAIRDGVLQDVQAVEALWDAAYDVSSSRSSAQDIPALLAHGSSARLLLAEVDSIIVGTLIATFDGWRGNMYRLAVHSDYQHRGIARGLVTAAHAWLDSRGCGRITALVEGDHVYATEFWASVGYTHDETMRRYHFNLGPNA